MGSLLTALFALFLLTVGQAQTRSDSTQFIRNSAKWYDLEFTEPEADSMMGNLSNYLLLYKSMHKNMPPNDLAYPFAFQPAPAGMKISTRKEKISWDIPLRTELP